jgi:hypothetical protein
MEELGCQVSREVYRIIPINMLFLISIIIIFITFRPDERRKIIPRNGWITHLFFGGFPALSTQVTEKRSNQLVTQKSPVKALFNRFFVTHYVSVIVTFASWSFFTACFPIISHILSNPPTYSFDVN